MPEIRLDIDENKVEVTSQPNEDTEVLDNIECMWQVLTGQTIQSTMGADCVATYLVPKECVKWWRYWL